MIFLDRDSVSRNVLEYTHLNQIISVHQSIYKGIIQRNLYVHFSFLNWGMTRHAHWGTIHIKYFNIMYSGLKALKARYKHIIVETFSDIYNPYYDKFSIKIGVIEDKNFSSANWAWKDTTIERINYSPYSKFLKDIFWEHNIYGESGVYKSLLKIFYTSERVYRYIRDLYDSMSSLLMLKTNSKVAFDRLFSYINSMRKSEGTLISPVTQLNPFLKEYQNRANVNPFLTQRY